MGRLLQAYLVPHPPVVVPAVGRGREHEAQPTLDAFKKMATEVAELKPDRVVVLTPHGCRHDGVVAVSRGATLSGHLENFGAFNTARTFENDEPAVEAFLAETQKLGLPVRGTNPIGGLDHGAFVPLHFLQEAGGNFKVMHLVTGMPMMPGEEAIGQALRRVLDRLDGDWVLIISGDLSHRLSASGPYGYAERGMTFEKEMERVIASGHLEDLDVFDGRWCDDAGQCGVGPLRIARGILGMDHLQTEILSHEWPFGVGYMVARFKEAVS